MRGRQDSRQSDDTFNLSTGNDHLDVEFTGPRPQQRQLVLKKVKGQIYQIQYLAGLVNSEENSVSITFPILISESEIIPKKAASSDVFFKVEKPFNYEVYFQLSFKTEDDKSYLYLKCKGIEGLFEYDIAQILHIFSEFKPDFQSYFVERTEVIDELKRISGRHIALHGSLDLGTAFQHIIDFKVNCLGRFEELTEKRDLEAYKNSKELRLILDRLIMDYPHTSTNDYDSAFAKLLHVLQHQSFINDPQILLSMTPVREALGLLSEGKLSNKGIEVTEQQMELVLEVLKQHEGFAPKENCWFPAGAVDRISNLVHDLTPNPLKEFSM